MIALPELPNASWSSFYVWASHPDRHGKLPIDAHANGAYKDSRTYSAYYGWQASRKQTLEECVSELRGMKANNKTAQSAINQCAEALEELK